MKKLTKASVLLVIIFIAILSCQNINIISSLIAIASSSISNGESPLNVSFTGSGEGGVAPYNWAWDLDGDGQFDDSTQQNPNHTYTLAGTYNVRLRITDSAGKTSNSNTIKITVTTTIFNASSSASPSNGTRPFVVQFSGYASGGKTPYTWAWDLDGDGQYDDSSAQNPSYTYNAAGTYNTKLQVTDANNAIVYSPVLSVVSINPPLTANALRTPASGNRPLVVNFEGSAAGGQVPYSWAWDLDGDGQYDDSTAQNPSHTYNTAGTYNIKLKVVDAANVIAYSSTYTVTVSNTTLSATASRTPSSGNRPLTVSFTGDATGGQPPYSWAWDLDGDGQYDDSSAQNPSKTYNSAGSFNTRLKVTDATNAIAYSGTNTITVNNPPLVATASRTPSSGQRPLIVSFSGSATGGQSPYNWAWDLDGDGQYDDSSAQNPSYTYNSTGIFATKLKVTDSSNTVAYSSTYNVTVTDFPDLRDDGSAYHNVSPTTIHGGHTFTIELDVRSSAAASGSNKTRFYLSTNSSITSSDKLIGTYTSSGIGSGSYETHSKTISFPSLNTIPEGTYYVGCIIDADNQVTESNESNNTILFSQQVVVEPIIEFIVKNNSSYKFDYLYISPSSSSSWGSNFLAGSDLYSGGTFKISNFTLPSSSGNYDMKVMTNLLGTTTREKYSVDLRNSSTYTWYVTD